MKPRRTHVISGQNHSGKTALLETLGLNFANTPHRSFKTLPTIFSELTKNSEIFLAITITKDEIENFVCQSSSRIVLPMPEGRQDFNKISNSLEQKLKSLIIFEIIFPIDSGGSFNYTRNS